MRLLFKNDIIRADKARKPKMKNVHGKTWDKFPITLDGKKVDAHVDTTWGEYFFFEYKKQWYACRMLQPDQNGDYTVSVDPTSGKLELTAVPKFQRVYEEAA